MKKILQRNMMAAGNFRWEIIGTGKFSCMTFSPREILPHEKSLRNIFWSVTTAELSYLKISSETIFIRF